MSGKARRIRSSSRDFGEPLAQPARARRQRLRNARAARADKRTALNSRWASLSRSSRSDWDGKTLAEIGPRKESGRRLGPMVIESRLDVIESHQVPPVQNRSRRRRLVSPRAVHEAHDPTVERIRQAEFPPETALCRVDPPGRCAGSEWVGVPRDRDGDARAIRVHSFVWSVWIKVETAA